jgi:hypothetical protein
MTDFEQKVLADLSELKANMTWLVGNGRQGRVQDLEQRIEKCEAFVYRAGGVGAALGVLLTLVNLGIDYLKAPR